MTFYSKVLARFVNRRGLRLIVRAEIVPQGGLTQREIQETQIALQELGMEDTFDMMP